MGAFPSCWTLRKGNAEVAQNNGDHVLSFLVIRTETEPSMKDDNYLPDAFTIDFDYLMNHFKQHTCELRFLDANGQRSTTLRFNGESCNLAAARGGGSFSGTTDDTSSSPGFRLLRVAP
jgi:OmpA-OmpF porin, OOP family